jgi:hypothetical protein
VSAFLIILSRGPVDLQFLKPHLSSKVHSEQHQHGLDFDSLVLRWDGWDQPIVVEGKNITLASTKSPIRYLRVPELLLKFQLKQLLLLQTTPKDIYLKAPQLEYDLSKGHPKAPSTNLATYINGVPAFLAKILSFKHLLVENATIKLFPLEKSEPVLVEGHLSLVRKKGVFHGEVHAKSTGESSLKGFVHFDPLDAKTYLELEAIKLNQSLLFALAPTIETLNTSFKDISCSLKFLHSWRNGFEAGKCSLTIDGLKIAKNDYFDQGLNLPSVRMRASFADDTFALNDLSVSVNKTTIQSHGIGKYHDRSIAFDLHTTMNNLPINDLQHVWPKQAATDTHEWLTANLRDGDIPKAYVNFQGTYGLKKSDVRFDKIEGVIDFQNARLKYVDSMPKIEKLNASAKFNKDQFDIKILSGMCNRLTVAGGSIIIGKLADPITYLNLNLDIKGGLPDVLHLINYKPLQYADKFNLLPTQAAGNANVKLTMRFPLEQPFDTSKIETGVTAKIDHASMKEVLGLPLLLSDSTCDVTVTDDKLTIKGQGLLNGSTSTFVVEKFFPSSQSKIKDTAQVKVHLMPKSLQSFGFSAENIVQGLMPTEINFKNTLNNDGTLEIKSDLTKTLIKAFSVVKPMNKGGALSIQAKLKDYAFTEIPKFEIKASPDILIQGSAVFSKGISNLKSLKINPLRVGASDLTATMMINNQGTYEVNVRAKSLDLSQYLDSPSSQDMWDFANERPIQINFYADRLRLGGSKDLVYNNLNMMLQHGIIQNLSFVGSMEFVRDERERVEMSIEPISNRHRRFTLKTDKAGSLFKCLGILENVRKGALRIVAIHDDHAPKSAWEGKLTMQDFHLLNAPFLSRFVSLAFPTGLADLSKGGELGFNYFKAKFIAEPNKIFISAGRAHGYSLGFSFSGNIGRGNRGQVNLSGSIIPAYFLNTLISKIPLIGELISGGKHEGLFGVSFNISGPRNDPQISVNPLSALTPGLLRKLFSPFDSNDDKFDEEADVISDDDKDLQYAEAIEE